MNLRLCSLAVAALLTLAVVTTPAALAQTVDQLTPHQVKLESVEYSGKRGVRLIEDGCALLRNRDEAPLVEIPKHRQQPDDVAGM